ARYGSGVKGVHFGRCLRAQANMRARFVRHLPHSLAQVDPEFRIGLAVADRPRPRHQPRQAKRPQCRFIKEAGALEIGDTDGDVVYHFEVLRPFSVIPANAVTITTGRGRCAKLELPTFVTTAVCGYGSRLALRLAGTTESHRRA